MKKMKKSLVTFLALILPFSAFVGCDGKRDPQPTEGNQITQEPTEEPTAEETVSAFGAESEPTEQITVAPTEELRVAPTEEPAAAPTEEPTVEPTEEPTVAPTEEPTVEPTEEPTVEPTEEPTVAPTEEPTVAPTEEPTAVPTEEPTVAPTEEPTAVPTEEPTAAPTEEPTTVPTEEPTSTSTESPTETECVDHVYEEWVLVGEPGCEDERTYVAECECGETQTKTEPALGHDEIITRGVLPTASATGRTEKIECDRCGEVLKESRTVPVISVSDSEILADVTYEGNNAGKLTFHWKPNAAYEGMLLGMKVSVTDGASTSSYGIMDTDGTWIFEAEGNLVRYTFTFSPITTEGVQGNVVEREFYWFPDVYAMEIPRVEIHTLEGELPTYTRVDCPEGCWGAGIRDADYVQSIVSVYSASNTLLYTSESFGFDGAKIKVRGNTSALSAKKPFKIKLSKKFDLLAEFVDRDPDIDYRNKDWLLMKSGYNANIAVGSTVSELVGNEWTPQYTYVTLFVNGEYRGLYILMESVDDSEARCNVSDSGYIVEMDAYWWNEDIYFTTPISENRPAKFTFKYPDTDDFTAVDECYAYIKNYLTELENVMLGNTEGDINDYLDMRTFAKWMLTHDLLASYDSGGSNMYMTKYDNTSASRMRMGPVWDYDSIFWSREKYKTDTFARIRYEGHFYMSYLSEDAYFQRLYREEFDAVKNKVESSVAELFEFFKSETYATLLLREKQRWGTAIVDQTNEEQTILAWFDEHIAWMDENVPSPIIPPTHDDNEGEWDVQ